MPPKAKSDTKPDPRPLVLVPGALSAYILLPALGMLLLCREVGGFVFAVITWLIVLTFLNSLRR